MYTLSQELQVDTFMFVQNFLPFLLHYFYSFLGDTREVYATIDDLRSGRVRIGRKVFGGGDADPFDPQSP